MGRAGRTLAGHSTKPQLAQPTPLATCRWPKGLNAAEAACFLLSCWLRAYLPSHASCSSDDEHQNDQAGGRRLIGCCMMRPCPVRRRCNNCGPIIYLDQPSTDSLLDGHIDGISCPEFISPCQCQREGRCGMRPRGHECTLPHDTFSGRKATCLPAAPHQPRPAALLYCF